MSRVHSNTRNFHPDARRMQHRSNKELGSTVTYSAVETYDCRNSMDQGHLRLRSHIGCRPRAWLSTREKMPSLCVMVEMVGSSISSSFPPFFGGKADQKFRLMSTKEEFMKAKGEGMRSRPKQGMKI